MDPATFRARVEEIDWESYETAYGTPGKVPQWLISFRCADGEEAVDAGHMLWASLCHQHAYVSSAALPAAPFIAEVLGRSETALVEEALDIFVGFLVCTGKEDDEPWMRELRAFVSTLRPHFERLVDREDGEVAYFAKWNLRLLDEPATK